MNATLAHPHQIIITLHSVTKNLFTDLWYVNFLSFGIGYVHELLAGLLLVMLSLFLICFHSHSMGKNKHLAGCPKFLSHLCR